MAYTDKAMISVLQKSIAAVQNREIDNTFQGIKIHLEGQDENDCFGFAKNKSFIRAVGTSILGVNELGHTELAKLLDKMDANKREKLKIGLDVASLSLSLIAILISAFALWVSTLNSHRPLVTEYPGRIVGATELLPEKASPSHNGNEQTESGESDSDTSESCADEQKNK